MNDQEILDNAPEGATHIDKAGRWHKLTFSHKGFMLLSNDGDWDYCNPCTDLRSLADIAKIAELENQWISVDDEMPSAEHAIVIVDFYGGNVGVGYPHKGKILDEPMGMLFNGVTHWQPMPAPLKEQE